jgi:hypothetical protein
MFRRFSPPLAPRWSLNPRSLFGTTALSATCSVQIAASDSQLHGSASLWAETLLVGGSDSGDVGGEEVDAVPVEIAARAVVVLGGARVGMAGQDLCIAKRDTRVDGVGDRRVAQ